MSSFVVRIPDMNALTKSWSALLAAGPGGQKFTFNKKVGNTLKAWPRIKWFYYCDDQDGNTIRIYDNAHLGHFGGSHYLEPDGVRKEHFERVIIRGRNMWSGDEAKLNVEKSLRNRFRNNPAWRLFSARRAPLKPEMLPPPRVRVRPGPSRTADIQGGMRREVRLWYFEAVNQIPEFDPAADDDLPDSNGDPEELLADFGSADLEGGAGAMRIVQACPIDYATDVRGGPYQREPNLSAADLAELQSHLDAEEVVFEPVAGEDPYNAVLSQGTNRYLAELNPPPSH
jgi:hypothetical protein